MEYVEKPNESPRRRLNAHDSILSRKIPATGVGLSLVKNDYWLAPPLSPNSSCNTLEYLDVLPENRLVVLVTMGRYMQFPDTPFHLVDVSAVG